MFFALIFAWIAFDEWKKLKNAAATQGVEGTA